MRVLLLFLILHILSFLAFRSEASSILEKSPVSSWALANIETTRAQELTYIYGRGRGDQVTVAVIDTGLDISHPALANNLWTNPGEIPGNGIDDDGNGLIDDVHGWNFVSNNNVLTDKHGHGTHVAGIITAVAPQAKIMALRYYDPNASAAQNIQNTIRAFRYAVKMKVQIINFSGGGPGYNAQEYLALREADANHVLVIAASGNEGMNTDHVRYYPADYDLGNILSVTASDRFGRKPSYANYGNQTVDIAAPGDEILSTLPRASQGEMSGTSQATSFATGSAALLLLQSQLSLKPKQVIRALIASSKRQQLNAYRALAMKDQNVSAEGIYIRNTELMDSSLFLVRSPVQNEAWSSTP